MTILCIETSTSVCSAAICKDGEPFKQCINYEGSNHARLLPLYIGQLLQEARDNNLTIDAVALSEGPGSYTGLRIGTSTAKGICYGLNIPLIPVPTLEILKTAAMEKIISHKSEIRNDLLCPMIDARRMEVYTTDANGKARAVVVESEAFFTPSAKQSVYYFGDGAAKCQKVLTDPNWHYLPDVVPEARYVGVLAEKMMADGHGLKANDIAYYEPCYLKEFIAAQSHVKGLS